MSFLREGACEVEESDEGDEEAPPHRLLHLTHVHDPEDEDDLVEDEVPELVLDLLLLRGPEAPEDLLLDRVTQKDEEAVGKVHERLEEREIKHRTLELDIGLCISNPHLLDKRIRLLP